MAEVDGIRDRLDAKLWIFNNQLSRRNLNDDQRALLEARRGDVESKIRMRERASKAGKAGGRGRAKEKQEDSLENTVSDKLSEKKKKTSRTKTDTRAKGAKRANVSERKLRQAHEVLKCDPALAAKVQAGELTLLEARRIATLEPEARNKAVAALESGADARSAAREANKAADTN